MTGISPPEVAAPAPAGAATRRVKRPSAARGALTLRIGFIVVVTLGWELLARIGVLDPRFASSPSAIAASIVELAVDPRAQTAVLETLVSFGAAFAVGTTIGIVTGVAFGLQSLLREAYFPMVMLLMSVPKSVFLPLIVLAVGLGLESGMVFGALLAFAHVTVNVVAGLDLIEAKYMTAARAYGARPWRMFVDVLLPGAAPGIFAGIWHGIRNSFVGVVIAQLFVSTVGIGYLVRLYTNNFQIDHAMALIFVTAVLIIATSTVWDRLERRLTSWQNA